MLKTFVIFYFLQKQFHSVFTIAAHQVTKAEMQYQTRSMIKKKVLLFLYKKYKILIKTRFIILEDRDIELNK